MRPHHIRRNVLAPIVQRLARRVGLDVRRYNGAASAHRRTRSLLASERVSVAVDVGAHRGEFARDLRALGFAGRILSFEPLASPFADLASACASDPEWTCSQVALGAQSGEAQMNVSANYRSSSLLEITGTHTAAAPDAEVVGQERVLCQRLDEAVAADISGDDRLLVKVDVQGHESAVLDGLGSVEGQVRLMVIEMSLAPMYRGQPTLDGLLARVREMGFRCVALDPVVTAGDGAVLQVDGWFRRES